MRKMEGAMLGSWAFAETTKRHYWVLIFAQISNNYYLPLNQET